MGPACCHDPGSSPSMVGSYRPRNLGKTRRFHACQNRKSTTGSSAAARLSRCSGELLLVPMRRHGELLRAGRSSERRGEHRRAGHSGEWRGELRAGRERYARDTQCRNIHARGGWVGSWEKYKVDVGSCWRGFFVFLPNL